MNELMHEFYANNQCKNPVHLLVMCGDEWGGVGVSKKTLNFKEQTFNNNPMPSSYKYILCYCLLFWCDIVCFCVRSCASFAYFDLFHSIFQQCCRFSHSLRMLCAAKCRFSKRRSVGVAHLLDKIHVNWYWFRCSAEQVAAPQTVVIMCLFANLLYNIHEYFTWLVRKWFVTKRFTCCKSIA